MTASNMKTIHERQQDRVQAVLDNEVIELTEWEEKFCLSLHSQLIAWQHRDLSDKQLAILEKLEGYISNGARPNVR